MLFAFDCDGVLVDSEFIASQVDAELLTDAGYPITAPEVTQRFAGADQRRHPRPRREGDRPFAAAGLQPTGRRRSLTGGCRAS